MPINLTPPTATNAMQDSQFIKNPIDNFTTWLDQHKAEMENRIANMGAINNWPAPVFNIPNPPNSNFQSLPSTTQIPVIPQTTVQQATPVTPPPDNQSWSDSLRTWLHNFFEWTNPEDQTTSWLYKTLAPFEWVAQAWNEIAQDTAKRSEQLWQDITSTSKRVGDYIQGAPDVEWAKQSWKYFDSTKLDSTIAEMQKEGTSTDNIATALHDLTKEWYIFQWINDKSSLMDTIKQPWVASIRQAIGWFVSGIWSGIGSITSGYGNVLEWAWNIGEWNTNLWVSQVAKWVWEWAWGVVTWLMPWATTLMNTQAFQNSPLQTWLEKVWEWANYVAWKWVEALWWDLNTEAWKNYQQAGSTALQLWAIPVALKWLNVWIENAKPYVENAVESAKPIVQSGIDMAKDIIPEAWEQIKNTAWSIADTAWNLWAGILWKTTWVWSEAIKQAFTSAGTEWYTKALKWETLPEDILQQVHDWLNQIKAQKNIMYWDNYSNFVKDSENVWKVDNTPIVDAFTKKVGDFWVKIDPEGNLDFSKSTISKTWEINEVKWMWDDIQSFGSNTLDNLDTLKQRISNRYLDGREWSRSNAIWADTSSTIRWVIADKSPVYDKMMKDYQTIDSNIKDISNTLALWKKASTMTAITRLSQVLKDNLSMRKEMVDMLESYTWKDIKGQLAWLAMNPVMARWLAWVWEGGMLAYTLLKAWIHPVLLWEALLASPRAVWEFAQAVGKTKEWVKSKFSNIKDNASTISSDNLGGSNTPSSNTPIGLDNISRVSNSNRSSINNNTIPSWIFKEPIKSTIPGSRKTTVEVPSNPLGNISKTLAKKQGVMVEPKWETKLLESPKNILPKPPKNEQQVSKPKSSDTIPEGYFKNAFWEIQKTPNNAKGGFINIGRKEIKSVNKLNTGEDITLVRWTWGKWSGAWESIRWKWIYLTDNMDVAKHYWPDIKTVTIKNSDILDGNTNLKESKSIISSLPKEMKAHLDPSFNYTYNSLIKTIEGNTGLEAEKISEAINNTIKWKYKWVKFEIWLVNDSLSERWLWNKNAFVIFYLPKSYPKPLLPKPKK